MISKHHNPNYNSSVPNIPEATGDRYYAQDLFRDFRFLQDRLGLIGKDISKMLPWLVELSGIISQGTGQSIDVPSGYGYVAFNVEYVDSFTSLPPSITNGNIESVRVAWTTQNDMNGSSPDCETYSVVDDGTTTNYVKVKYKEEDLNSRNKAKSSGSYYYEQKPHFCFVIDSTAPTNYDLCLAVFTSSGGTYTFITDNGFAGHKLNYTTLVDINSGLSELDEKLMLGSSTVSKEKAFRRQRTLNTQHGFWGDVYWKNSSTVSIRPKSNSGHKWIGVILNSGEYLEVSSEITISITSNQLNGLNALASEWYQLIAYKNVSGQLAFGFSWMPITTFSETNPTNTLTLAQKDSKDIGLLFPEYSELVIFDSSTKLQTPIWYSGGAYDASGELFTDSRTSTVATLNKNLNISSLAAGKIVYSVSGFKPIDYSTGNITSVIGARGWSDSGIRIPTNASANIYNFAISGNKFYYTNGTSAANSTAATGKGTFGLTTSFVNYRNAFFPVDKNPIVEWTQNGASFVTKPYYETYGEYITGASVTWLNSSTETKALHGILSLMTDVGTGAVAILGYEIGEN